MDNNNHYNIIEKNEIENDITNKNSDNQIKKNYNINASNGKEKIILNNENNINGKIKHSIKDKEDKIYNNEDKNKLKELINNGIEISDNSDNKNKIIEYNPNKNKSKIRNDFIELAINDNKEIEKKPILKEKIKANEDQNSDNIMPTQEINDSDSITNLLKNIKDLIIKSKQKIKKDLYKIEQKERQTKNANKNKIITENIDNNNYKKDIIKKEFNKKTEENKITNNNQVKKPVLNSRYDTNLNANNKKNNNRIENKSKNALKGKKSQEICGYKNENEIMAKKFSTQINVNNDNKNNYLGNTNNNPNNSNNDEIDNSSQNQNKESTSQKKNFRNNKYDNIDLNTFFTKSTKKEDKKIYNKQSNYNYIEENGGKIYDNEKKIKTIKEEDINFEQDDNKYKRKTEVLKKIVIPKEMNDKQNKEISMKESEVDKIEDNDIDKSELLSMNKELINKISYLKKEVEFSKNEMRKKDEKLLIYLDKYDKISSENAYNIAEIENLEEELMNRKTEMDKKTKKINELMNKNIGLEKKMDQLKIYYQSKENTNKNLNKDYNYMKYNNSEEKDNNRHNDIGKEGEENNNQYRENILEDEYEELSVDELHTKRNKLIKERNDITFLYNKLPVKLVSKEQIRQKNELERKLTKINNDLMKIRLQLKNYNQ